MSDFEWSEDDALVLAELGWLPDSRLTSDDDGLLMRVVEETRAELALGPLSPARRDELAEAAYESLSFQVVSVDERVRMICASYAQSAALRPLIPVIDEATLAFYHGYFTAAFTLLATVLESYVRTFLGWKPGDADPSFKQLREAVLLLPDSSWRDDAALILNGFYSRYHADAPTSFEFNRHGLLHGVRTVRRYDEMNCARLYVLLDLLSFAEAPERASRSFVRDFEIDIRLKLFHAVGRRRGEMMLIVRSEFPDPGDRDGSAQAERTP